MDRPEWLDSRTISWCASLIDEAIQLRRDAGDCDGPFAKGELAAGVSLACRLRVESVGVVARNEPHEYRPHDGSGCALCFEGVCHYIHDVDRTRGVERPLP